MSIFNNPNFDQHENVVFGSDPKTGLKCIIAIHNTNRGPALGGSRFWNYESEQAALTDVLRLSKAMTYKAAISNLDLGGGKAVLIGDPKRLKTPELLYAFGRIIDRMNGHYITAEDVGTSVQDMDYIRQTTRHVRGKSNGTGDPSPLTAYGTFQGIKAAVKFKHQTDDLTGLRVSIQGVGNVGYYLCKYLHQAGAKLVVSDLVESALLRVEKEFNAHRVAPPDIYKQDVHVYAPCALGSSINDHTIETFKAGIIAGSANNQLAKSKHGHSLKDLDILYAPDYVINAGGLINVAHEAHNYNRDETLNQVAQIHNTLLMIFKRAQRENQPTNIVSDKMAEERFMQHSVQAA